jgi:hypothetical protein
MGHRPGLKGSSLRGGDRQDIARSDPYIHHYVPSWLTPFTMDFCPRGPPGGVYGQEISCSLCPCSLSRRTMAAYIRVPDKELKRRSDARRALRDEKEHQCLQGLTIPEVSPLIRPRGEH